MHHPRQDNTYHGLCYTSRGALTGTRNISMGPPRRIDPRTHRTMSERSYHGATSRSQLISEGLTPHHIDYFNRQYMGAMNIAASYRNGIIVLQKEIRKYTSICATLLAALVLDRGTRTGVRYNSLLWMCTLSTLTSAGGGGGGMGGEGGEWRKEEIVIRKYMCNITSSRGGVGGRVRKEGIIIHNYMWGGRGERGMKEGRNYYYMCNINRS